MTLHAFSSMCKVSCVWYTRLIHFKNVILHRVCTAISSEVSTESLRWVWPCCSLLSGCQVRTSLSWNLFSLFRSNHQLSISTSSFVDGFCFLLHEVLPFIRCQKHSNNSSPVWFSVITFLLVMIFISVFSAINLSSPMEKTFNLTLILVPLSSLEFCGWYVYRNVIW